MHYLAGLSNKIKVNGKSYVLLAYKTMEIRKQVESIPALTILKGHY